MSDRGPEWFHAKRYGFGAGLPCAWQGWVVLLSFIGLITLAAFFFAEDRPVVFYALLFTAIVIFGSIIAKTTRGGFKWRWGKDEDTW